MAQTSIHPTLHSDLITSLSFSHHGNRLATSSLDHSVRVTSLSPSTGLWDANPSEFKAHDAPVLKVVWASPEFGPILASGGVDGLVKVWSEEDAPRQSSLGGGGGGGGGAGKRWVQKVALSDARGTIRDIEFAPPEFGIKLAAVSSDSHLRVWECLDPVALTDWSLIEDIDLTVLTLAPSSSSSLGIAGALGVGAGAAMLGGEVGVNGPGIGGAAAGPGPKSFEMGGGPGASPGRVPLAGSSLASSSAGSAASSFEGRKAGTVESEGGWALSWCKEAWWGERLAVSSGSSGIVRLFHLPDHAPWSNYLNLLPIRPSPSFSQPAPVSSLSWAPASGRSYQLLAAGSRDGRARVWKLFPPALDGPQDGADGGAGGGGGGGGVGTWREELHAELEEGGGGKVGSVGSVKVEWNATGTVLSTAGDDAKVRLWKSTYTGQWRTIAVISTEDADGMAVDK